MMPAGTAIDRGLTGAQALPCPIPGNEMVASQGNDRVTVPGCEPSPSTKRGLTLMDYLLLNSRERLKQMADKLQNSWSSVRPHTIDTKVTVLTMTAETDLDKRVWLTPTSAMSGDPMAAILALMPNPKIAWFDSTGHYVASAVMVDFRPNCLADWI